MQEDRKMQRQLYFEDVEIGMELPAITKQSSTRQFVQFAGADYDWSPLHYDHAYATKEQGLSSVVGQGALTTGFLGQVLTDWIGPRGLVRRVRGEYRHVNSPGDTLTVKGRVVEKNTGAGGNLVECDLWCENQDGRRVTIGSGTVRLPTRTDPEQSEPR